MEAKDLLTNDEIVKVKNQLWKPEADSDELINNVAEIFFEAGKQEGRRDVVEFVEQHGFYNLWTHKEVWQAQFKIWFKDNPELLKEWGIK